MNDARNIKFGGGLRVTGAARHDEADGTNDSASPKVVQRLSSLWWQT